MSAPACVCLDCQAPFTHALAVCTGPTCRARICTRCRDQRGLCAGCRAEAARDARLAEIDRAMLVGIVAVWV